MFDFIKKKIKDSINSIQKKLVKEEKIEEREAAHDETALPAQETKEQEKTHDKPATLKVAPKEERSEEEPAAPRRVQEEEPKKEPQGKKKLFAHQINDVDIQNIYGEIRESLLENNVALSVVEAIHSDLKEKLKGKDVSLLSTRRDVEAAVKDSIKDILMDYPVDDFLAVIKAKKPYIILFIGVNGVGKTTTLAKFAKFLIKNGLKPVISASDTFRAASIEQLETHTKKLGVEIIKHNYGADPAAVAFDAIKHARISGADIVLIDTAGRSDINKNLLDELKKVKRVSKPDFTIFVGDALTGNDVVNQAKIFDKEVGIDATILSKADVDKKGGAVLSISYITKKPIIFLGTGQSYEDLVPFNKEKTADFLLE